MSDGERQCIDKHNICYESLSLLLNHNESDTFCRVRKGNLATILDYKTQQRISNLVRSEGNHDYWIGGKLDVMDQLTWVDGTTYPTGLWITHQLTVPFCCTCVVYLLVT